MDLAEKLDERDLRHPWETARFEFILDLIRKYCPKPNSVFVDVGCGDAFFIRKLRDYYPKGQFYAFDTAITDEEITRLNFESGGEIIFANIAENLRAELSRPVDCVLFLDVIEHVEKDVEFLRQTLSNLTTSRQTIVIITVPAFLTLFTSHDTMLKHFRRYSLSTLTRSVYDSSLKVVTGGYFFSSLLLPRLAHKLKESIFGPREEFGIGNWQHGEIVTRMLARVLYLDAKAGLLLSKLKVRTPGLSAYVVCQTR